MMRNILVMLALLLAQPAAAQPPPRYLTAADIATILGFSPYSAANPAGYQTAAQVAASIGASSSAAITSSVIVNALGFTPYSAANPSGYQTATQVGATLGSILAYGGDPTGTRDSTAAFNADCAAITAKGGGSIYLPAGTYLAASPWVCNNTMVDVHGDGPFLSNIITSHTGVALSLAPLYLTNHTSVRDLGFRPAAGIVGSAALQIIYPSTPSFPYESTSVARVAVQASGAGSTYFKVGMVLNGVWFANISGFSHWAAAPSGQATPIAGTVGIEIANSFDVTVERGNFYADDIGVLQNAYSESIHLLHPNFVGANVGFENLIDTSGNRSSFSGLNFFMSDGECDVYVKCIALNQYIAGFINNNRIALRVDAAGNAGIDLLDTRQIHVGFNSFQMPTTTGNATGLYIHQAIGYGNENRVDGFSCYAGASCVVFGPGTSLNIGTALASLEPTAINGAGTYSQGFADQGSNNFMQFITGTGRVVQPGGFIFAGGQGQSLFQVQDVPNASNILVATPGLSGTPAGLNSAGDISGLTPLQITGGGGGAVTVVRPISCSVVPANAGVACSNGEGASLTLK